MDSKIYILKSRFNEIGLENNFLILKRCVFHDKIHKFQFVIFHFIEMQLI